MAESTVAAVQAALNRKQVELYEIQVSLSTCMELEFCLVMRVK